MKTKFYLKTMLLLWALIAGSVGTMWADTYEQLTSIASIDESAEYVLGIDGTGFHYSGTSSWGKTALPSAQTPLYYSLKKADDGNSFTASVTIDNTKYYLQVPTSNTFSMATATGTNTDLILGTTQVSGTNYAIANKSTTTRHLRINGTSGLRSYAGTTGTMAFFYKRVPAFTITAVLNNTEWGTVALSGKVITATPAAGYTYADPAYSVNPANSATVSQDGNKFTVTPSADTEVTINFAAIPTYTVTFSDGGSVTEETAGSGVTLPTRDAIGEYAFAGWSETNVTTETTNAPTIIPAGTYKPTGDITLYPVYTKTEGGGGIENKTASVTIADYAEEHHWSNSTKYTSVTLDENVTVTADGGAITGKYYDSNNTWRFYLSDSGTATVNLSNGTLSSVMFTFTAGNSGTLNYNNSTVTSGTAVNIDGSSAEFTIGNGNIQISAITVNYSITDAGTTYYWSAPVAATVARPEIVVAENPFLFSTTAEITCATQGATIYYSYDNTAWAEYTGALTIYETKTIYAKAVKDNEESSVATVTVTKTLAETTVSIDQSGITNTDVYTGTAAGSLAATVLYATAAVEGATVTWSGNNDAVATIDEQTGAVTLVAAGSVTFTASYAGDDDYQGSSATYEMTVTNSDPDVPGTENHPYTVAQALENTPSTGNSDEIYVSGIVSGFVGSYDDIMDDSFRRYYISDDGSKNNRLLVFNGNGLNNVPFSSASDVMVGDKVVVKGQLTIYGSTKELVEGNYIVSLVRKPTFSPAAGAVASGTSVIISCTTEGATIYYTTDGTTPTTESAQFNATFALTITEPTTIKAIAVKDNLTSDVATASYTIAQPVATPTFSQEGGTFAAAIEVAINCTTEGATISYSYDNDTWYEYTEPLTISETTTIYAKAEKEGMVASEVASATYTIEIPSIVFDGQQNPMNIAYTAGETNVHYVASYTTGTITLVLCDANGDPIGPSPYDWLTPQITSNVYVHVTWQANEDTENARTTYFKLKADNVESEVFRITQAKYVPDFATLPFSFDGGRSGIAETAGLTQDGLGGDYASSPYLKFDGKDDNVILKINERPGTLTFDIKGNSFSSSTFKVQTSEDGTTYTDLATYTELGDLQNEKFKNLDEGVRYIKWVYAQKASGNVALGNINLAKYVEPDPSITVEPDEVEVDAAQHNGTLAISYQKLDITSKDDFSIQFYDSDANALADVPDWLEVLIAQEQSGAYVVSYSIGENSGDERTAYFKVYAMNGQVPVYSNMVTITQAAYVAPVPTTTYTLATTITSGKHYIITNGEDKAMGLDRGSNRHAVDIDINEGTATVASDGDVYEVAIYGPYTIEGKSCYTIYDEKTQGYLLAASSSNNYLKTKSILDANGNWTIDIDSYGVATIKAQGSNTRNWMRYNYNSGSSPLFSCYGSGLDDIYLFERSDDNGSGTAEVSIASACTDGTKYYGTYSSTESFVAPTDVTVSEISLEDGKLVLHDFTTGSLIPANTGVLVSSETAGTKTLTQATGGSSILGAANCLRPTGAGITADDMAALDANSKFYRLTMHNGTDIGFWWGAADGAAFDVAPNKAYLALPATAAVRSGYSWTDETTGIGAALSEIENDGAVYDLQGRRVSKPASGLYIKNGKKVVVK